MDTARARCDNRLWTGEKVEVEFKEDVYLVCVVGRGDEPDKFLAFTDPAEADAEAKRQTETNKLAMKQSYAFLALAAVENTDRVRLKTKAKAAFRSKSLSTAASARTEWYYWDTGDSILGILRVERDALRILSRFHDKHSSLPIPDWRKREKWADKLATLTFLNPIAEKQAAELYTIEPICLSTL